MQMLMQNPQHIRSEPEQFVWWLCADTPFEFLHTYRDSEEWTPENKNKF